MLMVLPISSCPPRDLFYKMFQNLKISDILEEYQLKSSLGRFYRHFEYKGCFYAQNPTSFPNMFANQIIMQLSKSCGKFSKISLFIKGKLRKEKATSRPPTKINNNIAKWTSIVKTHE